MEGRRDGCLTITVYEKTSLYPSVEHIKFTEDWHLEVVMPMFESEAIWNLCLYVAFKDSLALHNIWILPAVKIISTSMCLHRSNGKKRSVKQTIESETQCDSLDNKYHVNSKPLAISPIHHWDATNTSMMKTSMWWVMQPNTSRQRSLYTSDGVKRDLMYLYQSGWCRKSSSLFAL